MNTLNKVIGYVRSNNNDNLTEQKNAIKKYAKENECKVLEVFVEKGQPKDNSNRAEFQEMLKYVEMNPKKVKILVVSDVARLSRNVIELRSIKDFLKFRGVKLISLAR